MKQVYFFASVALCISTALAAPVSSDVPKEDAAFIMKALTAAPEAIGKKATIVPRERRVRSDGRPAEGHERLDLRN
jgi:hypothetical protein